MKTTLRFFLPFLLLVVSCLSFADSSKKIKPYIVVLGPNDLNQIRINIENYQPTNKEIKKTDIFFGDGLHAASVEDVFHTYSANGKYTVVVKTWDKKDVLTTYSEVVDINSAYQVKDIANTRILGPLSVTDEKKYKLDLTTVQAARLYKLTLTRQSSGVNWLDLLFPKLKCKRDYNVEINDIEIFKEDEVGCNTTQLERFVVLGTENTVRFEADEPRWKSTFQVEIHAVEINKNIDTTAPVLTSNGHSNSLTNNPLVHFSVADASAVTTNVWNGSQQLIQTLTTKEFDVVLAEGVNNFVLQSIDASGNKSPYFYLNNIRLDTIRANVSTTLASQYIYSRYPQTFTITFDADEDLQALTVNNLSATMLTPRRFSYIVQVNQTGTVDFNIKAYDLASNETIKTYTVNFGIDNIAPVLSSNVPSNTYTNQNISVQINVTDNSDTVTDIYKDGILLQSSSAKVFNLALSLGVNNFVIKSHDTYGNQSPDFLLSNIVYDTTPASVTTNLQVQYLVKSLPQNISFDVNANEPLSYAEVDGSQVSLSNPSSFSYTKASTVAGTNSVNIKVKDLAGNITASVYQYQVVLDNTSPVVTIGSLASVTNQSQILASFSVSEVNRVATSIKVNGQVVGTFNDKIFSVNLILNVEGTNTVEALSTDEAGNVSNVATAQIIKDTVAPVLSGLEPIQGSALSRLRFRVAGMANEALSAATVNGMSLNLESDKKTFSGVYVSSVQGENTLSFTATDLAGNVSTSQITVNISDRLLVKELVTIIPDSDNRHYFVTGKAGAARPGAKISVSAGTFSLNRGSDTAAVAGTFSVRLETFSTVTVSAKDPDTGEEDSFTLDFNVPTQIAGVIKDTDDTPLPGATVRIIGSDAVAISNASGIFSIQNAPVGDQTLSIDGSTIAQPSSGPQRRFSVTNVAVSVSAGQINAFPRPIYLTATLLDGSGTDVLANTDSSVSDVNAPGVTLSIPAGAAIFPDGSSGGHISIKSIPSSKSVIPVPQSVVPDKLIALEPSGLKFKQPVELVLPNVNELKEGTSVFLISLNSSSGQWEIDGSGVVEPGGATIRTTPGHGLTHFSLLMASPTYPMLESVIDPNLEGISTAKGAMETSVSLPSYKSLGQQITPSLKYNSSWAQPVAFASNIFDIPKTEITYKNVYDSNSKQTVSMPEVCVRDLLGQNHCKNSYILEVYHHEDWIAQSGYFIDELIGQSWIGLNSTDNETFETLSNSADPNDLPGAVLKNTLKTVGVSLKNNADGTAIPNMSQMSFGIPLQKADGSYLKTGIYPSFTRFQAKLKELIFTTKYITQSVYADGKLVGDYSFNRTVTDLQTYLLDSILPKDLSRDILVQNKVDSPVGRGWNFNTAQKLVNTKGSKILVEEPNGDVSTYTSSFPIETVFNANGTGVDLNKGAGLSSWPYAYATTFGADKIGRVVRVDLTGNHQIQNVSQLENISGTTGFDKVDDCLSNAPGAVIQKYKFTFRNKPGISNVVQFPDGRLIATHTSAHSVIDMTNALSTTLGGYRAASPYGFNTGGGAHLQRYQALCNSLDIDCDPLVDLHSTQACNSNLTAHDETGQLAKARTLNPGAPTTNFANGIINGSGSFGTADYSSVSFNNPTGLAISPDGKLVVADTGSNVVYKINTLTGKINILAGDYGATDRGDAEFAAPQVTYDVVKADGLKNLLLKNALPEAQALAIIPISNYSKASIFHPKGLAYDADGNLYITSENGYVRKVDTSGKISTYAGKDLGNGGLNANNLHAELMVFKNPTGIVIDSDQNKMYVADTGNHRVVQIDMSSKIASVIAGDSSVACGADPKDGNSSLNAAICYPTWLGFDSDKNLLVLDSGHQRIRRIILSKNNSSKLAYLPSNGDLSTLDRQPNGSFVRTFRDGTKSYFNEKGQQISAVDRVGRTITYEYDTDTANLIKVTDATGQVSQLVYAGDRLNYFNDPAGRKTYFSYDAKNQLSQIRFPDNSTKSFEYDDFSRLVKEYNEAGNYKTYVYNGLGRLARVVDENGVSTGIGDKTSQTYNSPQREGLDAGKTNSSVGLPNGAQISMTNDANGFISKIRDVLGRDTTVTTDLKGKVTDVQRGASEHISLKYDALTNDLLETKNEITQLKSVSTFNEFGQNTTSTDFNLITTSHVYAPQTGLLLSDQLPNQVQVDYTYNSVGLPVSKTIYPNGTAAAGVTTNYEYDGSGNPTKIIFPDGKYVLNTFDGAGNVVSTTSFKNSSTGFTTAYEYDQSNRLKKVTSAKGEVTQYSYLATGQLSQITDPKGKVTAFEYDKKGQVVKKTSPEGYVSFFEYDDMGNLKKETDPNGSVKQYSYLANNKLQTAVFADDYITYEYDLKDQLSGVTNTNSSIHYARDLNNRVVLETTTGANSTVTNAMTYDNNGNRKSLYSSTSSFQAAVIPIPPTVIYLQKFDYNYDANNRLISMSNFWGDSFGFGYDQANRLTAITRPGSRSDYVYDAGSSLAQIVHSAGGVTKSFATFAYDNRNFITQKRMPGSTFNYQYDSNGQLTQADKAEDAGLQENFSYDELGNRTNGSTYDQSGQRIQDDGQYTYVYDNNGNMLTKSSKVQGISYAFEYNSRNQMKKAFVLSSPLAVPNKTVFYSYDALGRRTQKAVSDNNGASYTRKYIYDGDNIIAEIDGNNRLLASYTHSPLLPDDLLAVHFTNHAVKSTNGGDALTDQYAMTQSAGNFYYLKDHLNTVMDIINSQGNVVQTYDYSAFGFLRGIKDSTGADTGISAAPVRTSFTFTGKEREAETGLYYYRARYYDPSTGRFLQTDPSPGYINEPTSVVNKYIYAINNPTSFSDPSGRDIWTELGKGLSIVAAVVVAVYAGAFVAGYLGLSGVAGAIIGGLAGGLAGGVTAAVGYSLSHADPQEGFRIGAIAGFIAGGIGGYYSTTFVNAAGASRITPEQVFNFFQDQTSNAVSGMKGGSELVRGGAAYANIGSWPIWSTLAGYANAALPYAVGLGEVGAIGYVDHCIGAGTCSELVPKSGSKTWNWSF